jgi:uncharacterized protein
VTTSERTARVRLPALPAIVAGPVLHRRRSPFTHGVRFDTYLWLVDVDELPSHGPLARFSAADHFGGTAGSLREAVTGFADAQGAQTAPGDRIVMLAGARTAGHLFDPLSVFWCLGRGSRVRWAVLEIHNTYGERHAHLLGPDSAGKALVDKEFYVSPFFTVDGHYEVTLRLDPQSVVVSVNLHQAGSLVFTASFDGTPRPATRGAVVRAALRTPLVTHQTSARIRLHGIRLWLRRLPVVPRPPHTPPKGIS